jgi:hypothetical protein
MPRHEWTIVASSFAVDGTTNALSIFNILEGITLPPGSPAPPSDAPNVLPLPFSVITFWSRGEGEGPGTYAARLTITAPNGSEVAQAPIVVNLESADRTRAIVSAPVFMYSGPGAYTFAVALREGDAWLAASTLSIPVTIASAT